MARTTAMIGVMAGSEDPALRRRAGELAEEAIRQGGELGTDVPTGPGNLLPVMIEEIARKHPNDREGFIDEAIEEGEYPDIAEEEASKRYGPRVPSVWDKFTSWGKKYTSEEAMPHIRDALRAPGVLFGRGGLMGLPQKTPVGLPERHRRRFEGVSSGLEVLAQSPNPKVRRAAQEELRKFGR